MENLWNSPKYRFIYISLMKQGVLGPQWENMEGSLRCFTANGMGTLSLSWLEVSQWEGL